MTAPHLPPPTAICARRPGRHLQAADRATAAAKDHLDRAADAAIGSGDGAVAEHRFQS
jgi:hypothetical protein